MVITPNPDAIVWELCPACKHHMWDVNDARMADRVTNEAAREERSSHAAN
jgi:hypothetical protein